jgi:hypothetical protein
VTGAAVSAELRAIGFRTAFGIGTKLLGSWCARFSEKTRDLIEEAVPPQERTGRNQPAVKAAEGPL